MYGHNDEDRINKVKKMIESFGGEVVIHPSLLVGMYFSISY